MCLGPVERVMQETATVYSNGSNQPKRADGFGSRHNVEEAELALSSV